MKKLLVLQILLFSFLFAYADEFESTEGWPRVFTHGNAEFTIYQPQIDSYKNNTVEARIAASVKFPEKDLIFGAIWTKAKVNTDKDNRRVAFDELRVTQSNFPEFDEANTDLVESILAERLQQYDLEMSLDRFMASLDTNTNKDVVSQLKNDAPTIYYESQPTVLVYIDGEPILKDVEGKDFEYVLNTPYFIVKSTKSNQYYMRGGEWWYVSKDITSGWVETIQVPADIVEFAESQSTESDEVQELPEDTRTPKIIVTLEPAELITTAGNPDYAALSGTSLLYIKNSETDIIMDLGTQMHYILISGRWYQSKSLRDGKWSFIEPDLLPKDFAKIPNDSELSSVRHSVPGTDEANMALLEQSIPETATVDRSKASVSVQYDGDPKFAAIDGTSMQYAINADKTVIKYNNEFYCVDDAIWFVSQNANGPWVVSTSRPTEVDKIPASSPVYNVKYVYIIDYTPEVVYVGYTPGYTHAYTYNGVVVYGTGYHYTPWYGHYYYPRPVTYGFNVHYHPYSGWGFSFGMSHGWYGWGFHHHNYWWGPHGYHYGYRYGCGYPGYRPGHRPPNYIRPRQPRPEHYNAYRDRASRPNTRQDTRPTQLPTNRPTRPSNGSSSTRPSRPSENRPSTRPTNPSVDRPSTRPTTPSGGGSNSRPSTRPIEPQNPAVRPSQPSNNARPTTRENNVYTDKNGNVYRQNSSGTWENRSNKSWTPTQPSNSNINRDSQMRNRGTQQKQNYQQSRPAQQSRPTQTRPAQSKPSYSSPSPSRSAPSSRPAPSRSAPTRSAPSRSR